MNWLKKLFKNPLFKDFNIVFNGTLLAQLLNFGLFFFYPKFYDDTSFAYYGLVVSTVLILSSVINLKMNNLVMIVKGQATERNVIYSGLKIGWMLSTIITFILLILPIENYMVAAGITLFAIATRQPIEIWLNKKGKYNALVFIQTLQIIISGLFSLFFILVLDNQFGLIYGYTISMIAAAICCLYFYPISLQQVWKVPYYSYLKKHWKFNSYVSLSALINNLSRNSIVYILSYFYPSGFVGQFVYIQKVLSVPAGIYTQSMSKIFYRETTILKGKQLLKLTRDILLTNFLIGMVFLVVAYLGSDYFNQILGKNWQDAPILIRYLSLWIFITILVSPFSPYLEVRYKVVEKLVYNILLFFFRTGSLFASGFYLPFAQSILVFSVVGGASNLVLLGYILNEIKNEAKDQT